MISLVFSPCLYIWKVQAWNNSTSFFFLLKEVRPHWIWGRGAAGPEALAQVSADVSYSEMAQVLKGTAGLESGNVCLDLIYKYFLCYKTSFNSSCLQFSQVDASTVCHYVILSADCDSLGLSLHTCKVGLTALILIVYWWKKNQKRICQVPKDQTWEYLTYTAFF